MSFAPKSLELSGAFTLPVPVGLSAAGNQDIEAMSPQSYEEKMRRWQEWLHRCLPGRPA